MWNIFMFIKKYIYVYVLEKGMLHCKILRNADYKIKTYNLFLL